MKFSPPTQYFQHYSFKNAKVGDRVEVTIKDESGQTHTRTITLIKITDQLVTGQVTDGEGNDEGEIKLMKRLGLKVGEGWGIRLAKHVPGSGVTRRRAKVTLGKITRIRKLPAQSSSPS